MARAMDIAAKCVVMMLNQYPSVLDQEDIFLIPNVGCLPSGQQYNCKSEEVAAECAAQMKAVKLISMGNGQTLDDNRNGHTIPNLSLNCAPCCLQTRAGNHPIDLRLPMQCSVNALERAMCRLHILL